MYHPYCQSLSALTEYLKQKLCSQRAKRLGCSLHTQVELDIQLERNINSDFTLATTTLDYLERRGERNVPKRYLKDADWCEEGPLGPGYYIADSDDPSILIAIDFNFKYLQWGCTHQQKDKFVVERPAPVRYGLRIFDEERTQDRSQWGPLDGTSDKDEVPNPQFKFGSEAGGDTPDPDVVIPQSQEEENRIAAITQLIPSHISKPPIQPRSLAGAMAQIASATTLTDSLVASWELEYPNEETPAVWREYSGPFSPLHTVEEMEVEMILLNLTDEILESAKKEGREVVEVEMTPIMEVAAEVDLIQQVVQMQPTQGHYRTR